MGLDIEYKDGQTPLDEEEKEGLLIESITTRGELDEFEQLNIEKAIQWLLKRNLNKDQILSEDYIRDLHFRMYGEVWIWAGKFRKSNKNLGVEWSGIEISMRQLLDDCHYWIEHSIFIDEEIALRFKHKLVSIHCFSNGNGRHSRLMADIIIHHIFGKPFFTWGQTNINKQGDSRVQYLKSLKDADNGNIKSLLVFARS